MHALEREGKPPFHYQRLADGRVVELPNVETVQELERFVETEAKVALRGAAAAAHTIGLDRDVEFAAHLAQPVVERAEAFVEQVETAAARDVAYASHLETCAAREGRPGHRAGREICGGRHEGP